MRKSSSIMYQKHTRNFLYFFLIIIVILSSSCSSSKKVRLKNVNQVIETAKSYRGTPYKYGGTTRSGMDCSALIYYSFESVGMEIPRNSEAQSKIGKKIAESKIEKGDVLFFATGKNKKLVSHAGLVTEVKSGDVIFIHSSTSLGVTEDRLSQTYWQKAFLFAKRFF
jgi:probable lipoprotein NlpC